MRIIALYCKCFIYWVEFSVVQTCTQLYIHLSGNAFRHHKLSECSCFLSCCIGKRIDSTRVSFKFVEEPELGKIFICWAIDFKYSKKMEIISYAWNTKLYTRAFRESTYTFENHQLTFPTDTNRKIYKRILKKLVSILKCCMWASFSAKHLTLFVLAMACHTTSWATIHYKQYIGCSWNFKLLALVPLKLDTLKCHNDLFHIHWKYQEHQT